MADTHRAQLALQAWLSPAYPVGAYAYSHALEAMVEAGMVSNAESLSHWMDDNLRHGSGWNDAVLISESWRRFHVPDNPSWISGLREIAEMASVMTATAELRQESLQQGAAFLDVTRRAWPHPRLEDFADAAAGNTAYPVCFAVAAAAQGCALPTTINGYLFAMSGNWISAAVRMNIIGQTAGQELAAQAAPTVETLSSAAQTAGLDDLGGCVFRNEIASFHHETQNARLFRS